MQHQYEKGLRWHHRGLLMDYLIGLHHRFRMLPETLYLTVNIIDRFLSMRVVSLNKLQLVGLAAFFIASKFEEICAPSVQNLLDAGVPPDDCKEAEMLQAERYILRTLNWSVSLYPQPMNWLRRVSKADDYDPEVRSLAKFFLEIHVVEKKLVGVKPSLIAAASIWLGRLVMNHFGWVQQPINLFSAHLLTSSHSRHPTSRTTPDTPRKRSSPWPISCLITAFVLTSMKTSSRSMLQRSITRSVR